MRPTESAWLGRNFELDDVVRRLVEFGLVKTDNGRTLPLKSGGKTDIYVNLRDARSSPAAMRYVAELFAEPLAWLKGQGFARFAEIPDSVSCFAGLIADKIDMPYITIREEAKEGRATKGKVIGTRKKGEQLVIIDDVITDGASKIVPCATAIEEGLDPAQLVVLVDRQQGWQKLTRGELRANVWAGMTLHDLRRSLIKQRLLERCDPKLEHSNPLILALDGMEWEAMLPLLDVLRPTGTIFKVNDYMFESGFGAIPDMQVYGRVMVDVKAYDIPNTVANICKRLANYRPWGVTVHATGGRAMMQAAVKELEGVGTNVLAVTVLTSFDQGTCDEVYHRLPLAQVEVLARIAAEAGVQGFVCSPEEVKVLRGMFPDIKIFITPGVRSPGTDKGDQKRVATPFDAIDNGATHIVGGRQFTADADPVGEVKRVLSAELGLSSFAN